MEELNNIDWTYDIPDNKYFINDESNFEKSATFRIIKGTFRNPFLSSDSEEESVPKAFSMTFMKKKNKTKHVPKYTLQEYIPGLKKLPLYPQVSKLTPEQHKICINVLRFFNTNCFSMPRTEVNQSELKIFNELKPTIQSEQKLFSDHVKDCWTTKICGRHLQMVLSHEKFIESVWQDRLTRVKKYPQFYQMAAMLPLVYTNENPIGISLLDSLKNEGNPPLFDLPVLNNGAIYLTKSQDDINSSLATIKDSSNKHVSVCDDEKCEQLAIQHRANIVISSSGLKTLADNHAPFGRSWDLPVLIKDYKLTDAHGKLTTHTVAYVDRSLPPRHLTGQQKSAWCSKLLLKSALLQNDKKDTNNESICEVPKIEYCANCRQYAITISAKSITSEIEVSGKDEACDISSDSESEDLVIDAPNIPVRRMTTRGMARKCVKPNDIPESPLQDIADTEQPLGSPTEDNKNEECLCGTNVKQKSVNEDVSKIISDILNPKAESELQHQNNSKSDGKNVTYKLWKIGPSQQESQLLKTLEKDIIVLVRCKIDGSQMDNDGNMQALMVAPKLEYQIEFGAECVTRAETARNWTSLQFRPDSKLLRVRLIPQTGEIIMLEKLTLPSLSVEALKHNSWKPQIALGCFFNIFTSLSHLNPAQYLLRHEPTHHSFAMICISTPSRSENGIDLHTSYDLDPTNIQVNQTAQWNPIDPALVTPNLARHCIVPCMFTPGSCKTLKKQKVAIPKKNFKSKGKKKHCKNKRENKGNTGI